MKDLTTEFLARCIHCHNQLNDEQKKQLEEDLGEEARNTTIAAKILARKIFSEDTDRIILET